MLYLCKAIGQDKYFVLDLSLYSCVATERVNSIIPRKGRQFISCWAKSIRRQVSLMPPHICEKCRLSCLLLHALWVEWLMLMGCVLPGHLCPLWTWWLMFGVNHTLTIPDGLQIVEGARGDRRQRKQKKRVLSTLAHCFKAHLASRVSFQSSGKRKAVLLAKDQQRPRNGSK